MMGVMGPNRLVAWQRRAGMSGHVRVVAHMEKIDMADRCGVSAHSCDVVSHKVRWARWRLPLEIGVFENFRFCDRAMARNAVGARL